MKIHQYREMNRYLTRKPLSEQELQMAYDANQQMLNSIPPTPVASNEELGAVQEFNEGGRAKYSEGSKLTGTGKTLEQNIKDDHKAFNDYRKSIGQPIIPLDNAFIKMWQRTRLNEGGRAELAEGTPFNYNTLSNAERVKAGRERVIQFVENFKKENINFTFDEKDYYFFESFFYEVFYNQENEKMKKAIDSFFVQLFDDNINKTKSDIEIFTDIYKTLERSLILDWLLFTISILRLIFLIK